MSDPRSEGMHPAWWTRFFVVATIGTIALTATLFSGSLRSSARVTLISDRAGLVMDRGAKVKLRGVQIGRVGRVTGTRTRWTSSLEIEPDQMRSFRPTCMRVSAPEPCSAPSSSSWSTRTTPVPNGWRPDRSIKSDNVSTEINTLFRDVADILKQVDPAKLQATLSALAEGLRGHGEIIGQTITDTNEVLEEVDARADTINADGRAVRRISDAYSAAAPDLLTGLDAAGTSSTTITDNAASLDGLLAGVIGLARGGIDLIGSEPGQPDPGCRPLRIDRPAAVHLQPDVHLHAGRGQDAWTPATWMRPAARTTSR